MPADTPPADAIAGPRTLAIDIGGSHLKAGLLSPEGALIGTPVRVPTPMPSTPAAILQRLAEILPALGPADRIAAGFPGVVRGGVVITAPNLGTADWHGFALADQLTGLLGLPARATNDATVQGLGVIIGVGLECVITLGTGLGFALFEGGRPAPHLEFSQLPVHRHKTYDQYIGDAERQRIGARRWNKRVLRVIGRLHTLINYDSLLIGGGNTKYLAAKLPPEARIVSNEAGITGGVRLWDAAPTLAIST